MRKKTNYNGYKRDYVIAFMIVLPQSLVAPSLVSLIGVVIEWMLLQFFQGSTFELGFLVASLGFLIARQFVADVIAESVLWGVNARRSRYLSLIAAACFFLGSLPFILMPLTFAVENKEYWWAWLLGSLIFAFYVFYVFGVIGTLADRLS